MKQVIYKGSMKITYDGIISFFGDEEFQARANLAYNQQYNKGLQDGRQQIVNKIIKNLTS